MLRVDVPDGQFIPHHVGCAVKSIEQSYATYSQAVELCRRTRPQVVASQGVEVCFVELAPLFYLELAAPLAGNNKLDRYLKAGFYHLCFLVPDLGSAAARLEAQDFAALPAFSSEAFAGAPCQFFQSPQLHLIELVQMSSAEFTTMFENNLSRD